MDFSGSPQPQLTPQVLWVSPPNAPAHYLPAPHSPIRYVPAPYVAEPYVAGPYAPALYAPYPHAPYMPAQHAPVPHAPVPHAPAFPVPHIPAWNVPPQLVPTPCMVFTTPLHDPPTLPLTPGLDRSKRMTIPNSAISFLVKRGYALRKQLGLGSGGVVVQARSRKDEKVAIKVIDKIGLSICGLAASAPSKEVSLLEKLQVHRNIIELHDVLVTDRFVFIVMELAERGSLMQFIAENGALPENVCRRLFRDLITGLQHCHKNHVVHRDIKSENLLLDQNATLKLSDFGHACMAKADGLLEAPYGTLVYSAPELILRQPYNGRASDIWSAGIVLYNMVYGYLPFAVNPIPGEFVSQMIKGPKLRPDVPYNCNDLIKNILRYDPRRRPTIPEILEHPWMKQ